MNKSEIYNQLNWDAKLFIENIIKRYTTTPLDMNPNDDESRLKEYEDQILDLYNKNILFFIKMLCEFKCNDHICIYNVNGFLDKAMPLLDLLRIKVKKSDRTDADIIVEFIREPHLLLQFFANREVGFNDFTGDYRLITCSRNSNGALYMILPSGSYLYNRDIEMNNIYSNMQFHFDEYDNLEFSDDYKKYLKYFLTVMTIEN